MKRYILVFLFSFSCFASAQTVSCGELMGFIKSEGMYSSGISSYTLDSSWLKNVTLYSYDLKYYVIAEIKANKFSYGSKSYIFCNIPISNWSNFKNGGYGDSDSYGERFHKYIFNYQCACD